HGLMNPYSSVYTKPAEYGSANWQERMFEPMTCRLLILSTAQLALLVLMPWAIFASLSWGLMSLAVYLYPWLSHVMIIGTAMLVLLTVVAALLSRGRWLKKGSREDNHPRFMRGYAWWAALAVLSLIAFIAGSVVGSMIFTKYMKGYYDISNLDSYDNVDPSRAAGKQLLDAGRVIFVKGSTLQLKHAMAHQNSSMKMYCVAPIIAASDQPLPATYDLWAAGTDCCSDGGSNFTCGASRSSGARGGLRLLSREEDYNFRLAVEDAEFMYHLRSVHPLFFEWTVDPIKEITARKDEAFWVYFATNLMFLLCAFFLVVMGYACFQLATSLAGCDLYGKELVDSEEVELSQWEESSTSSELVERSRPESGNETLGSLMHALQNASPEERRKAVADISQERFMQLISSMPEDEEVDLQGGVSFVDDLDGTWIDPDAVDMTESHPSSLRRYSAEAPDECSALCLSSNKPSEPRNTKPLGQLQVDGELPAHESTHVLLRLPPRSRAHNAAAELSRVGSLKDSGVDGEAISAWLGGETSSTMCCARILEATVRGMDAAGRLDEPLLAEDTPPFSVTSKVISTLRLMPNRAPAHVPESLPNQMPNQIFARMACECGGRLLKEIDGPDGHAVFDATLEHAMTLGDGYHPVTESRDFC
ncbi:unnamed protein product, partial [Symbiodinium necroappetens]